MPQNLASFFAPQGVALIGASPRRDKISYGVLRNLLQYGYQGQVYPVNPHYQDIDGLTCYPDIASVPDPVDLAVTILPAKLTPSILDACGQRGLKGVVIVSGGFKETGPDGATIPGPRCRFVGYVHAPANTAGTPPVWMNRKRS